MRSRLVWSLPARQGMGQARAICLRERKQSAIIVRGPVDPFVRPPDGGVYLSVKTQPEKD
jgi:hypothetical protein